MNTSDKFVCIFLSFHYSETLRKDRSLGIMSQRFLMLFLVAKVGHLVNDFYSNLSFTVCLKCTKNAIFNLLTRVLR